MKPSWQPHLTVLANGLGGLPFVFVRDFPEKVARLGWAVSGGLMLSASVFNLIIPGLVDTGITPVAVGIFLGGGTYGPDVVLAGKP